MRVGEVDAGHRDPDQHLVRAWTRPLELNQLQNLGAAEARHLNRPHERAA